MKLKTSDYIFIGIGIFCLPVVIGFFILGTMAWVIGSRMEKEEEKGSSFKEAMVQFDKDIKKIDEDIDKMQESLFDENNSQPDLISRKRYKLKDYDKRVLEDGK